MGTIINKSFNDGITVPKGAQLIVELVGPAGAGKTTLANVLLQRSKRIQLGTPPNIRKIEHFPFFAKNTLLLVPTFLHLYQNHNGRRLTRQEITWLITLNGWQHRLGRQVPGTGTIVILDQGPVFMLAKLIGFGPETLKSQAVRQWLEKIYLQWAGTLDMVVCLDTPDAILLQRIRARETWHGFKNLSESEAVEILARFRQAHTKVLSELMAGESGPGLLCFDTAKKSQDEIAENLLIQLAETELSSLNYQNSEQV
jgi:thymidylate kinase